MNTQLRWNRGRTIALVGVVVLAVGGTMALAGHLTGTSYTGCLTVNGGTLTSVTEGDVPLKPCGPGSVQAHFGSGDITAVLASTGLTGGGTSGEVTLSVASTYRLPQTCTSGQIVTWNGTGWTCGTDADTQYTAGTGLQLSGTEFSIASSYRVTNNQACPAGQVATGINSSGLLTCGAPGVAVYANTQSPASIGINDDIQPHQVVTLDIPAGAYSIIVTGVFNGPLDDAEMLCELRTGATFLAYGIAHGHDSADDGNIAMMAVRLFTAPAQLRVVCSTNDDGVSAFGFGIQALKFN